MSDKYKSHLEKFIFVCLAAITGFVVQGVPDYFTKVSRSDVSEMIRVEAPLAVEKYLFSVMETQKNVMNTQKNIEINQAKLGEQINMLISIMNKDAKK